MTSFNVKFFKPLILYMFVCLFGSGLTCSGIVSPVLADSTTTGMPALGQTKTELNSPPSSVPATRLTLVRAKQTAIENNPTLEAVKERVTQAIEAIIQARADYLPSVDLASSWDYTETTAATATSEENQYTHQISASLVLFQGFYRKYNILAVNYGEQISRAELSEAQRILIWSVSQAFLNVQLAVENIRIAQSDMAFNLKQEEDAVAKERLGTGSYSDILNYKIKVNAAKAALIAARQSYTEYGYGLAALMGYEDSRLPSGVQILALNDSISAENKTDTDISSALENRPDLIQEAYAVKQADALVEREKSEFFPTISLTGAYGAGSVDGLGDIGDSDNLGASLGILVNFNLFSGGATRSAVRSALAEKRELANTLKEAKITATNEIRSAMTRVNTDQLTLDLQEDTTALTQTTRDLVKKEYNAGQASLVRMNEAQNDLVASQGDLADARISLALALEELDYYTGRNIKTQN